MLIMPFLHTVWAFASKYNVLGGMNVRYAFRKLTSVYIFNFVQNLLENNQLWSRWKQRLISRCSVVDLSWTLDDTP